MPGYYDRVRRAARITVRAQDEAGRPFELTTEGMLAVCIQHEMDHLVGKVFVDYLSPLKRAQAGREVGEKAAHRGLGPSRLMRIGFAGTPAFAAVALAAILDAGLAGSPGTHPSGPAARPRHEGRARAGQGARPRARHAACCSRRAWTNPAARDPDHRRGARRARGRGLRADSARSRCSTGRGTAASTSTPRCCRAGAARRRSSARCSPATAKRASRSCAWIEGLDTGPIIARHPLRIAPRETAGSLHDKLAAAGGRAIVAALAAIAARRRAARASATRSGRNLRREDRTAPRRASTGGRARRPSIAGSVLSIRCPERKRRSPARPSSCGRRRLAAAVRRTRDVVMRADASGIVVACGEGALKRDRVAARRCQATVRGGVSRRPPACAGHATGRRERLNQRPPPPSNGTRVPLRSGWRTQACWATGSRRDC